MYTMQFHSLFHVNYFINAFFPYLFVFIFVVVFFCARIGQRCRCTRTPHFSNHFRAHLETKWNVSLYRVLVNTNSFFLFLLLWTTLFFRLPLLSPCVNAAAKLLTKFFCSSSFSFDLYSIDFINNSNQQERFMCRKYI